MNVIAEAKKLAEENLLQTPLHRKMLRELEEKKVDTNIRLPCGYQRYCPNCIKTCFMVAYGVPIKLGKKKKEWFKTICYHCKTEWYIDPKGTEAFTKEELQEKHKTYFQEKRIERYVIGCL